MFARLFAAAWWRRAAASSASSTSAEVTRSLSDKNGIALSSSLNDELGVQSAGRAQPLQNRDHVARTGPDPRECLRQIRHGVVVTGQRYALVFLFLDVDAG